MPGLSIIIINFNSADYTRACLQSLNFRAEDGTIEIIVVDNASAGDDAAIIRGAFPSARVFANAENRGFPGGNNDGVRYASGEWLLFLNNDTELDPETLADLEGILGKADKRDIITGNIRGFDGKPQLVGGCDPSLIAEWLRLCIFNIKYIHSTWMDSINIPTWKNDKVQELDWATGCFFAMRRDFYLKLGGFDENIFMYLEDADLHKRARNAGGRVLYYPQLTLKHAGGGSSRTLRGKAIQYQYQSTVYYFRKHRGVCVALLFRLATKPMFLWWLILFAIAAAGTFGRVGKLNDKLRMFRYLLGA